MVSVAKLASLVNLIVEALLTPEHSVVSTEAISSKFLASPLV
jgi:hypothetical protein